MSPRPGQRLGPEFSRPFSLEALGEDEVVERIEASEAERSAVARRLSLLSLDRLAAVLRVRRADERQRQLVFPRARRGQSAVRHRSQVPCECPTTGACDALLPRPLSSGIARLQ